MWQEQPRNNADHRNRSHTGEGVAEQFSCEYSIQPTEPTEVGIVDGPFQGLPGTLNAGETMRIEQEVHIVADDNTPNYNADFVVSCSAVGESDTLTDNNSSKISSTVRIQ